MSNWEGETVLLTGGASFIGSHLAEDLVVEGASVRVADDFSSGTATNLEPITNDIEIFQGNLKHRSFADKATENIDTMFHLAADNGGRGYISNYPANCATNMALDNIVYEAAAENEVERICFASSA